MAKLAFLFDCFDLLIFFLFSNIYSGPTHMSGHTLDLRITREQNTTVAGSPEVDCYLSDHASILCRLSASKPCQVVKEITYCKIKSIDLDRFREDLGSSELCNKIYPSLDDMVSGYDSYLYPPYSTSMHL